MLNIHKFQSEYELFTTLCIVGDSDLAGIYDYLTSSRGSCCKFESIVIVISGNWEYETGFGRASLWCWSSSNIKQYKSNLCSLSRGFVG